MGHDRCLRRRRRSGLSQKVWLVRKDQHEVDQVPDLLVIDRRIVGWHLGASDPLGNSPVEVEGPASPLVNGTIQVGGTDRISPVVQLLPPELLGLGVKLVDPRFTLAGIAAENHLVEDFLANEAWAIPAGERAVAPSTFQLLLGLAQEQLSTAKNALAARRGPRDRRIHHL